MMGSSRCSGSHRSTCSLTFDETIAAARKGVLGPEGVIDCAVGSGGVALSDGGKGLGKLLVGDSNRIECFPQLVPDIRFDMDRSEAVDDVGEHPVRCSNDANRSAPHGIGERKDGWDEPLNNQTSTGPSEVRLL